MWSQNNSQNKTKCIHYNILNNKYLFQVTVEFFLTNRKGRKQISKGHSGTNLQVMKIIIK